MTSHQSTQHPLILVVEDEVLIRVSAVDLLAEAGFDVLEACNADEALTIIEANNDVCLVFTDVNMPGKRDGLDLVHDVHKRWPDIQLIVTSARAGLTDSDIPDDGRFVRKPYDERRLLGLVNDLLHAA